MADKEKEKKASSRANKSGSLTFSKLKNQHLRRTRIKEGKPTGSFRDGSENKHPSWI